MKWAAAVVVLLAAVAYAAPARYLEYNQANANTTTPATLAGDAGMSLYGMKGWRMDVCANLQPTGTATTLGGTGYVRVWGFEPEVLDGGAWGKNPALDCAVTATNARCQVCPDVTMGVQVEGWRVIGISDGITVIGTDGGVFADGGVTVRISGSQI